MVEDRFKKISHNYTELFTEVFAEQGLDYSKFEQSVLNFVSKYFPKFKNASILDVGCGDGETLHPFVKAGCTNLTGIDLNEEMLKASKKRFGRKVTLLQMDARKLNFEKGKFDIIVTGMCVHNIPKTERKLFWKELLRLYPNLFVAAEKISDPIQSRAKKYYEREIKALIKVYEEKHGLPEVAREWVKHSEYDELEKLTLDEIEKALSKFYKIKKSFFVFVWTSGCSRLHSSTALKCVVFCSSNLDIKIDFEMGVCKTIVAIKKITFIP